METAEMYLKISDQYDKLCELDKRKKSILASIEEQEKLTPEIEQAVSFEKNNTSG